MGESDDEGKSAKTNGGDAKVDNEPGESTSKMSDDEILNPVAR